MASTKPLTDALSQLVSRANGVANDPEVRSSVRRLGSDLKGLGGAVAGGWKGATADTPQDPAGPQGAPQQAPAQPPTAYEAAPVPPAPVPPTTEHPQGPYPPQ
jgi:hypothetical protein